MRPTKKYRGVIVRLIDSYYRVVDSVGLEPAEDIDGKALDDGGFVTRREAGALARQVNQRLR